MPVSFSESNGGVLELALGEDISLMTQSRRQHPRTNRGARTNEGSNTNEAAPDLRLQIANLLLERIETVSAPWQKPWKAGEVQAPINAVSGTPYRGLNHVQLMLATPDPTDPRWCTYKQAQEQGWQVRKGAHGVRIEVWKQYEHRRTEDEIAKLKEQGAKDVEPVVTRFAVRYYFVFHASQIDGIPTLVPVEQNRVSDAEPDPRIADLVRTLGVSLAYGGGAAFYRRSEDHIQMPPLEAFVDATAHDTVLLHELGHSTGHPSRLNREPSGPFGSETYAVEELRAELSAAMTAASLGIGFDPAAQQVEQDRTSLANHAAYLASWLHALPEQERKSAIMGAITDAQAISTYLLERVPVIAPTEREEVEAGEVVAPATRRTALRM
jgi:antirestriction protein ArdC